MIVAYSTYFSLHTRQVHHNVETNRMEAKYTSCQHFSMHELKVLMEET